MTPGNSPYIERFWEGHRYLKERQRLHQQLQPDDLRYKEVKILRSPNGQLFLSKTLEDELKDEKHVLDYIESELQREQPPAVLPEHTARHRQALDERAELDRQKQQVSEWRAEQRFAEQKQEEQQVTKRMLKKAKLIKRQKQEQAIWRGNREQQQPQQQPQRKPRLLEQQLDPNVDLELDLGVVLQLPQKSEQKPKVVIKQTDDSTAKILNVNQKLEVQPGNNNVKRVNDGEDAEATPRSARSVAPIQELDDDLVDTREQRRQFQNLCQSSHLYGNANCLTPWTLFSK